MFQLGTATVSGVDAVAGHRFWLNSLEKAKIFIGGGQLRPNDTKKCAHTHGQISEFIATFQY